MSTVTLPYSKVYEGPLLLVNRDHPLRPAATQPKLLPVGQYEGPVRMEYTAAKLLLNCLGAVGATAQVVTVSGWRSGGEQQQIWDDTLAQKGQAFTNQYVALPGCSEHQSGLAIDLGHAAGALDFIRPAFPYTGICGAFRHKAIQYGFIERYQKGKEQLTGIAAEPWHFRYVGAPHAMLMQQYGLCLEEYLDFLRAAPRNCQLPDGRAVTVRYVAAQGPATPIQLAGGCCQISGDNAGGFVVTEWGRTA